MFAPRRCRSSSDRTHGPGGDLGRSDRVQDVRCAGGELDSLEDLAVERERVACALWSLNAYSRKRVGISTPRGGEGSFPACRNFSYFHGNAAISKHEILGVRLAGKCLIT
jgi:hypothetical protein